LHLLRRAAIFLLPLLSLAAILYLADSWVTKQKSFKAPLPKAKIVVETKKNDVEYRLRILNTTDEVAPSSVKISKSSSFFTVVLDPTHGGDDVGSIGYKSAVESNINLQFAFKLARALRMKGVKVYLTRMDDVNTPVDVRLDETVKRSPSLFLSINCSYSDIKSLRGMEIYGFTPPDSENKETPKSEYYTKSQAAMVVENRVSLAIKEDLDLAYKSGLERKFFKFMALPSNIPTLGIFVGYISNGDDVEQLENEKFIDNLAERIAVSIEKGLLKKTNS